MKIAALAFVVAMLAVGASAECILVNWTAREFVSHATDLGRAIGASPETATITAVLFGTLGHAGDIVNMPPHGCCPRVVAGTEYYVRTTCPSGSGCEWIRVETDRINGVEDYVRERHRVSRVEVVDKLRAWREYKVPSADFRGWLATADYDDDDVKGGDSLTLAVIKEIEYLLDFVEASESCRPQSVGWFREFGTDALMARFSRLPREEKLSAYEAWLDAHEGSDDLWDSSALQKDVQTARALDPSWKAAEECVWQWQQKRWWQR